ncbi:MAG: hypothetical protein ACRDPA_28990, partial [Solirubrobacteraceae bacterium]
WPPGSRHERLTRFVVRPAAASLALRDWDGCSGETTLGSPTGSKALGAWPGGVKGAPGEAR